MRESVAAPPATGKNPERTSISCAKRALEGNPPGMHSHLTHVKQSSIKQTRRMQKGEEKLAML